MTLVCFENSDEVVVGDYSISVFCFFSYTKLLSCDIMMLTIAKNVYRLYLVEFLDDYRD